jgi:hypothetical protein
MCVCVCVCLFVSYLYTYIRQVVVRVRGGSARRMTLRAGQMLAVGAWPLRSRSSRLAHHAARARWRENKRKFSKYENVHAHLQLRQRQLCVHAGGCSSQHGVAYWMEYLPHTHTHTHTRFDGVSTSTHTHTRFDRWQRTCAELQAGGSPSEREMSRLHFGLSTVLGFRL